ncbi:hypothetical protein [Ammoniphilus sp. 3BR4]|uniref:hypothetical protein n=1 Tax=Ammoniphilus sp. 3BR4 TaxID=3158265 RepID=UPI00346755C0
MESGRDFTIPALAQMRLVSHREGYRKFRDPANLEAIEKYAAFFLDFAKTHQGRTKNDGYLGKWWEFSGKEQGVYME